MEKYAKSGDVSIAAAQSGMHRQTAAKYLDLRKLPSELKKPRTWRTRPDDFADDWPRLETMLQDAPELEAKALFEWLCESEDTGDYQEGQLRTFQRKVKRWRALHGEDKEVFFPQQHRPGEALQVDFTHATALGVTIAGEAFAHLLCHPVLPYSNWEWATVCLSESLVALRRGFQSALFELGSRPEWGQTDHSTAATHDLGAGDRAFNAEYLAMMEHFGLKPRTIAVGKSQQNGDVESANGALKARLKQHLLLRGHKDFKSVEVYEAWVQGVCAKANQRRHKRLVEELQVMKPMVADLLPEWLEDDVRVNRESTVRVKENSYSVPSRLIGETLRVRIYDDHLEFYYAQQLQLSVPRLLGRKGYHVNYRHVIDSLVRKPGAFRLYRYRPAMFPTVTFREAYDAIAESVSSVWHASLQYLRILQLAAQTLESEVETAVRLLLDEGLVPDVDRVGDLVGPRQVEIPDQQPLQPNPADFDALLTSCDALRQVA